MKVADEVHDSGKSPQKQWWILPWLGATLLGGTLLFWGLRYTIQFLDYFITPNPLINCFDSYPFKDRLGWARQIDLWGIHLGLALAAAGGSLVVVPLLLWKAADEVYRSGLSIHRRWWTLRKIYTGLGGLILLVGLGYAFVGLWSALRIMNTSPERCISLTTCLRDFYRGLILTAAGGSLAMLAHLARKTADETHGGDLHLPRRWWAFQHTYTGLGGLILLIGLWFALVGLGAALHFMNAHPERCISPTACRLGACYMGLVLAAVGGGLSMLPYLVLGIVRGRIRRTTKNQ